MEGFARVAAFKKFGVGKFLFERPTQLRITAPNRTQGAGPDLRRGAIASISGPLAKMVVRLAAPPTITRDALTMLTEPDMQARYVAATLAVIEAELRRTDTPAVDRSALFALVAGATKAATQLADELEQPGRQACESVLRSVTPAASRSNIIEFRR
jgi:hypothetical protein